MTTYKVIGKSTGRKDGPPKVTGAAGYAVDVALPGMLSGKSVRSPYPHAKIRSIDTSVAEALPGVHVVLTGADVQGYKTGSRVRDVPVLADGIVRFVGEKVAVVAAETEEIAERGRDLVDVRYEELEPLLDAQEALRDGAALIHPEMLTYNGFMRPPEQPSNRFFYNTFGVGDVDTGFAEAELTFEETYVTNRVHHGFIEPRACVVWANHEDRIQVWTSHKAPHGLKGMLASTLDVDREQVLVNPTYVGGDFGAKGVPWDELLCYFISLRTGRPVKMVMDYSEELLAGNPRHESVVRVKTGVKRDGTITAHHMEMLFNTGAYAGLMPVGFLAGADRIAANLKIPHAKFEVSHVYTNNVPGGFMRGPGEAQATFALESHMDEIARRMEIDPLEFRRKNILMPGDLTPMNETFEGVRALEALEAAVEASGFDAPKASGVGRGIAMMSRPAGPGETHAAVTLEPSGSVLLQTPIFEQGSGTHTIISQVAAEVLGIDPDVIRVESWDTDAVANDSGVAASRTVRMAVPAAHDAATEARAELLNVTAELLGWPVEQLTTEGGQVRRLDTNDSVPWTDILGRMPDRLVVGRATSKQVGQPEYTSFAAQVAEVYVDRETGNVELRRFITAHDVGTVLNPIGHQGQINGGVMMGMGYALMEELHVEDGRPTTLSLADFKMPTMQDIPEFETVLVESNEGTGPYNTRSIGESPTLGVAPAIANAIMDAVGVRIRSLPITAEKVLAALREKSA
jgi:CO/xanthine dehydrogenase Mo-binding subunit